MHTHGRIPLATTANLSVPPGCLLMSVGCTASGPTSKYSLVFLLSVAFLINTFFPCMISGKFSLIQSARESFYGLVGDSGLSYLLLALWGGWKMLCIGLFFHLWVPKLVSFSHFTFQSSSFVAFFLRFIIVIS